MYSTCLFCNNALGANESIEHFPVGRRLAYDAKAGRLWVVCKQCERWNLSPLESRWEAIEEAERAFRGTKLRVSTDNIGLAQLKEGTELVRIGAPLRPEFAAWRYGDQFGKRQKKFAVAMTAAGAGLLLPGVAQLFLAFTHNQSLWPLATAVTAGFASQVGQGYETWRRQAIPRLVVRDAENRGHRLTYSNARCALLRPNGTDGQWDLKLPHVNVTRSGAIATLIGGPEKKAGAAESVVLTDKHALDALGIILPYLNSDGGSKKNVREAVDIIDESNSVEQIMKRASGKEGGRGKIWSRDTAGNHVSVMPSRVRLAMEMSLHETGERRALEGGLQQLEQRWRDADEIAKIADSLLISRDIDEKMDELHRRNGK